MVSFRDLMHPPITIEAFLALREKQPKRIYFGSTHKSALKPSKQGDAAGFFNVPFVETISRIFPWQLFPNKKGQFGGYFRTVGDGSEFAQMEAWINAHSDLVFIRSLLTTALATCEHYGSNNQRSPIGELEHSAKYQNDQLAAVKLVEVLERAYARVHHNLGISGIVSVPPSIIGTPGLPNRLAAQLSARLGLPDLTSSLRWNGPKNSIKELSVDKKWMALEHVGITAQGAVAGQNLLLLDDMYQSGATAHFIASRLRAAGANDIHLLAVSKGRRDTDNT